MPAFNVTIPQNPARYDLYDPTDPIDRQLDSLDQSAALMQSVLYKLTHNMSTVTVNGILTGAAFTAGTYPYPERLKTANKTAYEQLLDKSDVLASAGLIQLLNEVNKRMTALSAICGKQD